LPLFLILYFNPLCFKRVEGAVISNDNFDNYREEWEQLRENWEIISEPEKPENHVYKTNFSVTNTHSMAFVVNNSFDWKDYSIEVDMLSKNGVDQLLFFRADPENNTFYSVDLRANGWIDSNNIAIAKTVNNKLIWYYPNIRPDKIGCNISNNIWYRVKVISLKEKIKVEIKCPSSNTFKEVFYKEDVDPILTGIAGIGAWSGSWSAGVEKWFDNFVVKDNPTLNTPLILLPGLGASWNTKAMVYGESVNQNEWQMTSFVNIYERFIKTAEGAGYTLGNDLFVFNYDWRKRLPQITNDFNDFINGNDDLKTAEKFDFVGHSLGGLIARAWSQTFDQTKTKTNNLITVGSPHLGAVKAYEALAGGKIGEKMDLGWIGMQILLQVYRRHFETNAALIRNIAPILNDIIPTFNFLKKNDNPIPAGEIAYPNTFLKDLNQTADILSFSHFVIGNSGKNTPEWLLLSEQSLLDKLLNLWPDGILSSTVLGDGDQTVLKKSAYLEGGFDSSLEFNLNHGDLINNQASVEKIFDLLGKSGTTISGPDSYPNDNLLIFYLASPAKLKVDSLILNENDLQMIVFPNPLTKTYQAEIQGTADGTYHLYLGQVTPSGNFWQTYEGVTTDGETDTYSFDINFSDPKLDPLISEEFFNRPKKLLASLYEETIDKRLKTALTHLIEAQGNYNEGEWSNTVASLKNSLLQIAFFRRSLNDEQVVIYNRAGEIMELLINNLEEVLKENNLSSKTKALTELHRAETRYSLAIKIILLSESEKNKKQIQTLNAVSLKQAEENIDFAKNQLDKNNFPSAEAKAYFAYLLSVEGFLN